MKADDEKVVKVSRKLVTFIRSDCANYQGTSCWIVDGKCLVELGERCEYFEKCLLPSKSSKPSVVKACEAYQNLHNILAADIDKKDRMCKQCQEPVSKGYSFRSKYKKKRQKDAAKLIAQKKQ